MNKYDSRGISDTCSIRQSFLFSSPLQYFLSFYPAALQLVHDSIFDLGVSKIVREEVRQSFFHLFSEFIEFHTVPPSNLILSKNIEHSRISFIEKA